MTIYLAGYTGHKPEALKDAAVRLDAIVADIRYSPNSHVQHWRKEALQELLGSRYRWLFALGNRNYRTGAPFDIVNLKGGCEDVHFHAENRNVILLCACAETSGCHREIVGESLAKDCYEVEELEW